jgi:hypothetical protein
MPLKTPQQMTEAWATKMGTASDAYKKGVAATTTDPAEAAIAEQGRMIAGIQSAVASGRWANGLRKAAAKGAWKAGALGKGADRLTSGAIAAKPKMMEHATAIYPVNQQLKQTLAGMPKGGKENAKQRFAAMLDAYDAFKQAKGAS